jgi:hypothetical protein
MFTWSSTCCAVNGVWTWKKPSICSLFPWIFSVLAKKSDLSMKPSIWSYDGLSIDISESKMMISIHQALPSDLYFIKLYWYSWLIYQTGSICLERQHAYLGFFRICWLKRRVQNWAKPYYFECREHEAVASVFQLEEWVLLANKYQDCRLFWFKLLSSN